MLRNLRIRVKLILASVVSLLGLLVVGSIAVHSVRLQMIEDRITMVRNMTDVGRGLIQQQYDRFLRGEIDEAEAKRNAIETLRRIRYANGEYFFIDDYQGYSVLLPIRPELEGTDVLGLSDSKGRFYVRMQRDAALAGGGTVRYEFTKPNTGVAAEKLAYVQPFTPWGWFVATGIYLDDVDRETNSVLWRVGGVFAAIIIGTTAIIRLISRSITRPLGRMSDLIARLTRRDYDFEVKDLPRADEIGDIARAIEVFKRTGQEFSQLQLQLREQEETARAEREAALAFQRDSALRLERTARLVSMGEMAASLAHELNQPLAAVGNYCMGCVRRLEAGGADLPALTEAMRKAASQSARASRIIARIRSLLSRREPALKKLSLRPLLEETAAIAEIEARRRGFSITPDIPDGLPPIFGDATMIEQVVFNLLRNAIQATSEMPSPRRDVVLGVEYREDTVEIRVADRGPGIPEADRERIFEPFFTTKPEGMGLGLNICRSMVEFHGGQIRAEDNRGGGAVFICTLRISGARA